MTTLSKPARAGTVAGDGARPAIPFWAVLAAILLAGIALRALRLTDGLWMDEGISVTFVTEAHGLRDLLRALAATDESERLQQLYVIVLYYWVAAFGDGTVALRMLSMLPGVATMLLLADAARRLYDGPAGSRRAALWAAGLAAGSAFLVYFSAEIRACAVLTALTAVFVDGWIADRRAARPHAGTLLACLAASALLCLGSIHGVIPLTVLALCDVRLARAPRRWFRFWLPNAAGCIVLFLVLYGPVILGGTMRDFAGVMQSQGLLQNTLFVVYGITVGQSYGPPLEALHGPDRARLVLDHAVPLLAYAAAMALLLLLVVRRLRRVGEADLLAPLAAALVLALVLGAGLGWVQNVNWLPRHAFYLSVLFVLVVAGTLGEPGPARPPRWGMAAAAALVLMNLAAVYNMDFRPAYALDDYRGVADLLRSDARGAVPVMLSGNLELLRDYYGIPGLVDGRQIRAQTLDAELPAKSGNAPEVIAVLNRQFYWTGAVESALPDVYAGPGYRVGEHTHRVYFDLYRLSRQAP